MTTPMHTVTVPAARFEDSDDSLAAAVAWHTKRHPEADGWDLSPSFADDRQHIVLTVPVIISDERVRALRDEAGAAGDLTQVAVCDRALDEYYPGCRTAMLLTDAECRKVEAMTVAEARYACAEVSR